MLEHHARSEARSSRMAGVPNTEPHKYSGLLAGPDGVFAGVAPRGSDQPSYHYFGVQVVEAAAFDAVPADTPYESVAALYPALNAARPGACGCSRPSAAYHDIGTPLDYFDTSWRLPTERAPRRLRGRVPGRARRLGAAIDPLGRRRDRRRRNGRTLHRHRRGDAFRRARRGRGQIIRRLDGDLTPGETAIGGPGGLSSFVGRSSDPPRPGDDVTATMADVRARIDQFLADCGLAQRGASVVALTGDASDRRYFRVLVPHDATQVLAVHPGPIDFEQLPFVNVAGLLAAMPVPVPRILAHSNELGIIALQDLGDVTLQAHLGAATRPSTPRSTARPSGLIETLQRRGAALAGARLPALRHRVRRRKAHLGAQLLREALPRGVSRRRLRRRPRGRRSAGSSRRSSRNLPPSPACCAIAITTAVI